MNTDKLTEEKKRKLYIKGPSDKTNLDLFKELAKQKKAEQEIIKVIEEENIPQVILEVYCQRFLS